MSRFLSALAATLLAGAAQAGELAVIESSGAPALPPGGVVADDRPLAVPAGGRVVLMDASGRTLALAGPFEGVPTLKADGGDSRLLQAVATLVASTGHDVTTVGATRGYAWRIGSVKTLADVMALDASEGGRACLYDLSKAELVRSPTDTQPEATLMAVNSGEAATLAWPADSPRIAWPADVPLRDGESYLIEQPAKQTVAEVTIKILQGEPASLPGRLQQFVEAGCDDQARLLLALMANEAGKGG
ncbi:MAG TPA: hypothetical protein VEH84_04810 [Alphaproteobacteria bacterium]|nr:hypothetical protein [Alphaproteobacteria bacterium]